MSVPTNVVFQGVKFYWRTRNTIDVTIVEHSGHDLTEVILFDPALNKEAPRIYLSSAAHYTKLDHDNIEYQISFAKRNNVPITEKFVNETVNKAKSDFLLSRLVITEYSVKAKILTVALQDNKSKNIVASLIREKPSSLLPYSAVQPEWLMYGLVDQAVQQLSPDHAQLRIECDNGEKSVESSLTYRERWRIPIVFIKISSGKRLSAFDAKIWSSVSHNMNTEQGATRMAAVFARTNRKCRSGVFLTPTASPTRNMTFFGEERAIAPCTTPLHNGAVQWKQHQDTVADRARTQSITGAGFLSKQSSSRWGNTSAHALVTDPSGTPTRPVTRNNSTNKTGSQPLLGALHRLSLSLTTSEEAGAEDGQSALQRMISSLGALNNSLRASLLGTSSGKFRSSGSTGTADGVGQPVASSVEQITTSLVAQNCLDTATQEDATGDDLHNAVTDVPVVANLSTKPQSQGHSSCASTAGAASIKTSASSATTTNTTACSAVPSAGPRPEFTVQGFFSGLVHWRSGNKIYVDTGAGAAEE